MLTAIDGWMVFMGEKTRALDGRVDGWVGGRTDGWMVNLHKGLLTAINNKKK